MDEVIYAPYTLCPTHSPCGLCWNERLRRATADLGSHEHEWLYSHDLTHELCMACGAVRVP